MEKTLKTCSHCGSPMRVDRVVPAANVVCGRCDPDAVKETQPSPDDPPDDLRMTGSGLIAFAIGLICVVTFQLALSALTSSKSTAGGIDFLFGLSNCGLVLGYGLIAAAGLMCMFTPKGSRATRFLISSLLIFLVVILLRVSLMTGTVGESFRIVSFAATIVWSVLWSLYVWRVSAVVNRRDLGRTIAMVLPLPGICLSIAWAANWLHAWTEALAVIRPLACCLAMFIAWTAVRLGYAFLGRNEVQSKTARSAGGEQLQPS